MSTSADFNDMSTLNEVSTSRGVNRDELGPAMPGTVILNKMARRISTRTELGNSGLIEYTDNSDFIYRQPDQPELQEPPVWGGGQGGPRFFWAL